MWNLIPWKKENGAGGPLTVEPLEREFSRIRNDFDSLLSRLWTNWPGLEEGLSGGQFGAEFEETEMHYVVRVTAPGFEIEDFDVSVAGNHLVVKAERKESQNGNGGSHFRYGRLQRVVPLPDGAKQDEVEARYHSGILELKVPKGKESTAKRIEVKSY